MDDMFVGRVMSTDLRTVGPDTLVEDAAQLMLEEGVGSVLVVDESNEVEGILTTTDFVSIVAKSQPKAQTTVTRYMSTDVITTTAGTPIHEVAEVMLDAGIHHVPVVDDEEGVIGIVTTTDLAAYLSHVEPPKA
ncbi:CBS domain-containing protein [Salinirubellus sp. GCM10025818]|jgi:signal-transduction protein with cAMP-binding, CBS, and nucleotidyltransferase domain|uniref:CBS domain-containing protein n=1 Tax=Salinirubellus TaxID=2162630 RepID=UPI0030D15829